MDLAREFDRKTCILVAACTLGTSVSIIPVSILTMGVFMKPLGAAFGWGRGDIAFSLTLLTLSMALAMPFAGRLIDRIGARPGIIYSLALYSASIFSLPGLLESFGLAGLYGWSIVAGLVGAPSSSVAYVKVLTSWFDRSRGLALGFAMSGIAAGGAIAPLLAASAIEAYGWQAGAYSLAALPLIFGLPASFFARERSVLPADTLPGTTQAGSPGHSLPEALRSRIFWILILLFLLAATAVHGLQIHLAPLLSDRGLDPAQAALGVSFMFAVSLIVRLGAGFLFDRVFAPWIGALSFAAAALGCGLLITIGGTGIEAYLFVVALLGVGAGAESDLLGYLVSRYFGLRAFGAIYGCVFSAFMIGSATGPLVIGMSFDRSGDYTTSLLLCTGGLFLTTLLLFFLPRFPSLAPTGTAEVTRAADHPD